MVPHMVIEEAINKLLGEAASVVTAVPDEQRGEKLIAFYSRNGMAPDELWENLNQSELPKLWIPKRENIHCIDTIPLLGSGKVDLNTLSGWRWKRQIRNLATRALNTWRAHGKSERPGRNEWIFSYWQTKLFKASFPSARK